MSRMSVVGALFVIWMGMLAFNFALRAQDAVALNNDCQMFSIEGKADAAQGATRDDAAATFIAACALTAVGKTGEATSSFGDPNIPWYAWLLLVAGGAVLLVANGCLGIVVGSIAVVAAFLLAGLPPYHVHDAISAAAKAAMPDVLTAL